MGKQAMVAHTLKIDNTVEGTERSSITAKEGIE